MRVNGYEVPAEVEKICIDRIRDKAYGRFKAEDIAACAEAALICKAGMDADQLEGSYLGDRLADRLIQRERKAKTIKMSGKFPYWEAV